MRREMLLGWLALTSAFLLDAGRARGNGGPIFRREVNPPAVARGTMAVLLPDLQPGRESRLEVVKEELRMQLASQRPDHPLVTVSATYTIRNPTSQDIELKIGFPILASYYVTPLHVKAGPVKVKTDFLDTQNLLEVLRKHARQVIEAHIAKDADLGRMVAEARARKDKEIGRAHV
jgi:hypothetical protein